MNSVPQLKYLSTEGLHEEICEPGDSDDSWPFLLSAEPDAPAACRFLSDLDFSWLEKI